MKAGCQPYWNKLEIEGMPTCENFSMLEQYGNIVGKFAWMHRSELIKETKCEMPCSFMEYKVSVTQFTVYKEKHGK